MRKASLVFVGVAVAGSALGLYGATTSNAGEDCGNIDPVFCTELNGQTPAPSPAPASAPVPNFGNWGRVTNRAGDSISGDGYADSARAAHPETAAAGAPAPTPAPAPHRRTPTRPAKKKVATAPVKKTVAKPPACTETSVTLPQDTAWVGGKTLHTHCLHAKGNSPIFAVSNDQFKDINLNLSTLPTLDTTKTGAYSYVCGMEKTHGNNMDVWVLTKGVNGKYGWVNSQQIVETGQRNDGSTPGLWNCLAAP